MGTPPILTFKSSTTDSASFKFLDRRGRYPKQEVSAHVFHDKEQGGALVMTELGEKLAEIQAPRNSNVITLTVSPGIDLAIMTALALIHDSDR
ncbi:hypothetical protein OC861_005541 [Tilletia horrida]|nr:hypothetical protein OC861_005541 [Tilletia horrida]